MVNLPLSARRHEPGRPPHSPRDVSPRDGCLGVLLRHLRPNFWRDWTGRNLTRLYDKTIRRRANVIKGEASNQGQFVFPAGLKDADIFRLHDIRRANAIFQPPAEGFQLDDVAGLDVFQTSKQSIAMARHLNGVPSSRRNI